MGLSICPGEFLMVLGRSGCGKSTLLNIMGGTIAPTEGEVTVGGQMVNGPDASRILLTQQPTLLPWLTVFENVAFGLRVRKETKGLEERVNEALALVRLEGHREYLPSQLSVGMQQRVCMARAMVGKPSLLMMDEPFGSLDALTRAHLQAEVIKIRQESPETTLVFVTHDIEEALLLGSRLVVLGGDPGRIVADYPLTQAYPRNAADPELLRLKETIMNHFREEAS